ncbi:MAG: endonuclease domain-containing protein [Rhizobiaceae bacterium]|nr:MAG: endonuclease domain-containing protein [Rhizobiaceae bacterium]
MTTRPRQLRRNATDAENRLWYVLRNRGLGGHKFVRQMAIGPFIADFVCREAGLIVELDGGQHGENAEDIRRTTYLNAEGYSVLRFWNNEVMDNRDGVLEAISRTIAAAPSPDLRFAPATLSPTGRGIRGARAAAGAEAALQASTEGVARP